MMAEALGTFIFKGTTGSPIFMGQVGICYSVFSSNHEQQVLSGVGTLSVVLRDLHSSGVLSLAPFMQMLLKPVASADVLSLVGICHSEERKVMISSSGNKCIFSVRSLQLSTAK